MQERVFEPVTAEELRRRALMYEKAEYLGIDLLAFDLENNDIDDEQYRKDVREASILLGEGKEIPEELEKRLLIVKNRKMSKER